MPFGLINAPASFQRLMERVVGDLRWKGVLVYLDDVLIHTEAVSTTLDMLEETFRRFREARLTIKMSKCDFFPASIEYLGHIIEAGLLRPNPKRIEKLRKITAPRNVRELRGLLGHFSYYREYIPQFAEHSAVLTDLLKKDKVFRWDPSFSEIIVYFIDQLTKVTLANRLETDEFLLETDASEIALGAVLSCRTKQGNFRPVEFGSRTLSEVERRWPAHEREAYAIVWALDKFDHFLRGREVLVYTDNSSLVFMERAVKGKLARWAARMAEYSLAIHHKSGKQMEHIDFLSRYIEPEEEFIADRMLFILASYPTFEDLKEAQSTERPSGRGYMRRDGLIFYRGRLWIPEHLRGDIMATAHMVPPHLHPGARKTKSAILRYFCWANIHEDVAIFVKRCLVCQRIRPGTEKFQGISRIHPVTQVLDRIYIDIWQLEVSGRMHYYLTMLDWGSRWVECARLQDKTAQEISKVFLSNRPGRL